MQCCSFRFIWFVFFFRHAIIAFTMHSNLKKIIIKHLRERNIYKKKVNEERHCMWVANLNDFQQTCRRMVEEYMPGI